MDKIQKNNLNGVLWMIGTILCFCMMGISIKELSIKYNSFEIQNFRNIFCIITILIIYLLHKKSSISTYQLKKNFIRNFFHLIGQSSWT